MRTTLGALLDDARVFSDGDWVESKDQDPLGGVRLVQLADIGVGRFLNKSARFMTEERAGALRCTYLQKGDLLIARMPDPIGRACLFPGDTRPCVTVVDVCVIRANQTRVDHRWLMHWFNSEAAAHSIAASVTGTTRQRISRGNLAQLPVSVPPLDEQRRIASILDAADALRSKRRQALEKLDSLAQSIFIDMFGDVTQWPELPSAVSLADLEDSGLIKLGRGIVISRNDITETPGSFPIYSSAAKNNGEFGRYGKYMFDEEMITWSVDGGGTLFYRPRHRFSVTNVGGWVRVLERGRISTRYLHAALSQLHSRLNFDWTMKAHPSVIRRLYANVLMPPIESQNAFENRANHVDSLRAVAERSVTVYEEFFASLQQRGFRGEL